MGEPWCLEEAEQRAQASGDAPAPPLQIVISTQHHYHVGSVLYRALVVQVSLYVMIFFLQVIQVGRFDQKSTGSERKAFLVAFLEEKAGKSILFSKEKFPLLGGSEVSFNAVNYANVF